uniref:Uncharacterized protein n=1 Tax=Meloidogyne incognita TaxID=6306 RepID=A0A914L1B5_MELIC
MDSRSSGAGVTSSGASIGGGNAAVARGGAGAAPSGDQLSKTLTQSFTPELVWESSGGGDGELLLLKLEDATFYYFIFRFYFILNTTIMENIFLPMTHRIGPIEAEVSEVGQRAWKFPAAF